MTVRRWIATLALGLAVALPSAGFAQEPSTKDKAAAQTKKAANKTEQAVEKTGEAITDTWITTKLKADFVNEKTLEHSDINVDTVNHVVTLKGTVASSAGKARAAEIAKTTKGVTKVVNTLTIAPHKDLADKAADKADKAADKADKAGDKAAAKADKAGEKTKETAGTAGEVVTDSWITTKLKADFVNEDTLKGSDINVDTNNHVVTLKGTVASLAGKTRAAEIAKTTKGVTRVVNELTLAPKK
jgi:hyperosmotically inducible protein